MKAPTPKQIREARHQAGHTQAQAADLLGRSLRAWNGWERGERPMDPNLYELYRLKTGVK